ncbi:MBL fold metallo-hydrolase [Metasolibacillus sp.]|uniref:MBL fold metallo-hydrolase n=1 Tax=Metasolibacillus sp. TaxID=2703680 RepID=UPI0025E13ABD|nr:MBL fold metallo-hydrolase [Metasolibacillus sp.]MCT6924677.1 MBL fold metallo-hydrolase [Metasolibacillus sp.]MCT6940879.1 MBL fold metallo-hydrolase [Metasolibacillus sp.]
MKKIFFSLLVIALLLAGCTVEFQQTEQQPVSGKEMRVHFIDVGQGDSILIQSPSGKTMLIDGGVKGAGKMVVDYLREQGVNKLDYVVATHPDADHIGGLIAVLNSISIKHFIDSGKVHTSQTFEEMLTLVSDKNIVYSVPEKGDIIDFDKELKTEVIYANENASDNNDASIVLKITYGEVSFLLTGDAGVSIEKQLLNENIQATVLKAGHHGSNTSSSLAFVQAVKPEAIVLSYGQDNKYGHPHAEVIENALTVKSKIYGTAEAGTIVFTTNGVSYNTTAAEWTGIGATSSVTPKPTTKKTTVELMSKDLVNEVVVLQNTGSEPVSLQGWQLVSVEGNQVFNFPNITLQPNGKLSITSGADAKDGKGKLKWTSKQIWSNSGDAAKLINVKGEIVSELE